MYQIGPQIKLFSMKLFRLTTILLFIIACISESYSQKSFQAGKIITNNNDTIVGFIDSKNNSELFKECRFKQPENSQVAIYKPRNIKAFIINNGMRKFVPCGLPFVSGDVFLEVLCEGGINLYYLKNGAVNYFVQKKGETTIHSLPYERQERDVDNGYTKRLKIIESTYHIDTLKMVMKDKPSLYPDIEKIQSPERKSLIEIVRKYNLNSLISQSQQELKKTGSSNIPELLRTGKINLYVQSDSVSGQHFYIQKGSTTKLIDLPFTRMENTSYQGILIRSYSDLTTNHMDTLKKYMADAKPLYTSIEEIRKPTKAKLEKLIDEYNSYKDEKTYDQKHALKRLPLNIDIDPGFYFVIVNPGNQAVIFGSFVAIGFQNSNEHYFLKTGLFVYKSNTPLTDRYYTSTDSINPYIPPVTAFKLPLLFEYRFSGKTIQPCLSVGYNFYLFNEIAPYNKSLLPVISPGVNFLLGRRFSLHLNVEIEFKNENQMAYFPKSFERASLFSGLQIKL